MIDRQYGKYVLVCDYCGEEIEFKTFDEALEYKKENGWRSIKHSDGWETICEECRKEIEG
ncbi:MAG: hypothetical protein KatS3mg079_653 [Caloramator sp.]|nr:MAG: hypothetical protein KatS3mg079_653 [Caloramator sp.]